MEWGLTLLIVGEPGYYAGRITVATKGGGGGWIINDRRTTIGTRIFKPGGLYDRTLLTKR